MKNIAVIYYSSTGNTKEMAEAIVKGIEEAGAKASLFTSAEFDPATVADYDAFALGCPASGAESLEASEFEPMFEKIEKDLAGKKVLLFGSFGWGNGPWMEEWADRCKKDGMELVSEGLIFNGAPAAEALAEGEALGKALA